MSDPRVVGPQQRSANLSDLIKAKSRASLGEKVNFCPFGCDDEDLDDLGYCEHLIGIALPDGKTMEPVITDDRGRRRVVGASPQPVQRGDKLVRITTCSRVYRDKPTKSKD